MTVQLPSGNSVELLNLIKIARLTEDPKLEAKAVEMETSFSDNVKRAPIGHTYFLTAVDFKVGPSYEIVNRWEDWSSMTP